MVNIDEEGSLSIRVDASAVVECVDERVHQAEELTKFSCVCGMTWRF